MSLVLDTTQFSNAKEASYKKELEDSRSAILNVLEDYREGAEDINNSRSAILNVLEDYREGAEDINNSRSAILNVLEDLQASKMALEQEKAALLAIGDGAVTTDANGKITLCNETFEDLLGWKLEEVMSQDLTEVMRLEDEVGNAILPDQQPIILALSTRKKATITTYVIQKNKKRVPVAVTATPILLENKTIGTILVFRDITKEKEINRLKDEFVSTASHELRTPLTAIDGLVSMILDGEYGDVNQNLKLPLEDVNTSSERLIHLVNDLLNLSRINAGRMKYTLSDFPIADIIIEAVHLLQPLSEQKGLQLITTKLEPVTAQADSDKVKEVLNNLIGNSLKFTDKGGITISTKVTEDRVGVYITDTGIGITNEDQVKLFGQFQQLESGKGTPTGTGLGLHISREIVRKMGGDVWLESSEPGKGSTFAFSIPKSKSELARKAKEEIEKEDKVHPDQKSDGITQVSS